MKVRIGQGATAEEARAIATALAEHLDDTVEVVSGDGDDVVASADPPEREYPLDDDLGPTEREDRLR